MQVRLMLEKAGVKVISFKRDARAAMACTLGASSLDIPGTLVPSPTFWCTLFRTSWFEILGFLPGYIHSHVVSLLHT